MDIREALKGCGLFDLDSELMDQDIRERIDNELSEQQYMLAALDYWGPG